MVSSLVCGEEHFLIYNDHAAQLYGGQHPGALGRPLPETYPSDWPAVAPFYRRAFAGEPVVVFSQSLELRPEEGGLRDVFDAYLTPVRRVDGSVAAVLMIGLETGERLRVESRLRDGEERQAFLLSLSDTLRPLSDPSDIQHAAMKLLAEQHDVMRAAYLDVHDDGDTMTMAARHDRDAIPTPTQLKLSHYGPDIADAFRSGRTLFVKDTEIETETEQQRLAYRAIGVRAWIVAPLVKEGRLISLVGVQSKVPRDWSAAEIQLIDDVAERTWSAVERARAELFLRRSEERFRLMAEAVKDYAIFLIDPQGRITEWFQGAEAVFGWSAEEVIGKPTSLLFTLADRASGVPERELETAHRAGVAPDIRWHPRKDGFERYIEGHVTALRSLSGDIHGYVKIGKDVTSRHMAEEALRQSEERFKQFGEASSDVLWIRHAESLQMEYVSPAFEAIYGMPLRYLFQGDNFERWKEVIHPDDLPGVLSGIEQVRGGQKVSFEYRIRRSDGGLRWLRDTDFPLRGSDGRVIRIGGIGQDITEERENAERMNVMVRELHHRTRNLIGMVQSIVYQTFRSARSMAECQEMLNDRLQALSNAQNLLSQSEEGRITLEGLLETELQALAAAGSTQRVTVSGPSLPLNPSAVQVLALVVHELVTNARKYGFLTQPDGRLAVSWSRVHENGDEDLIVFRWAEDGRSGPGTVQGQGYGRQLIERAIPLTLGGTVRRFMTDEGLSWEFRLPARKVLREG